MKKILFQVLVIMAILSGCSSSSPDWKFLIFIEELGSVYYDTKSIAYPSKNTAHIAIKLVPTEGHAKEVAAKYGKEFKDFHHTEFVEEINCKDKVRRPLRFADFTNKGTIILFQELEDSKWHSIVSGSVGEGLYRIVCE